MKRIFSFVGALSLGLIVGSVQADPSIVRHEQTAGVQTPLTLIHTVPTETDLGKAFSPEKDATKKWRRLIDETERSLDWAAFYVSNEPGSQLELVLKAMRRAASRGVKVRLLADKGFYEIYPKTLENLDELENIVVKLVDYRELMGGPMHAKYFIADGEISYVGSHNTDWRALEHIFEMGMVINDRNFATDLGNVFESDWKRSKGVGRIERWAGREGYPKRMVTAVRDHDSGGVWY
ncbi:MAG: hypothetical protein HKN21_16105, partial [Candidatus Eisenbacteria bacterium]|nr:hypothetical protein [Candidatus Eisenbacteria bacterium]